MTCLSEPDLLLAHYGEGRAADHDHLRACLACAARYRALAQDLHVIDTTLREPRPERRRARPALWRWSATIAGAAAALALVAGGETWLWRVSHTLSPQPTSIDAETLEFLERVSVALSNFADANVTSLAVGNTRGGLDDLAISGEEER